MDVVLECMSLPSFVFKQECNVRWKLAIASTRADYDRDYYNNMQRIFSGTTEKDKSAV